MLSYQLITQFFAVAVVLLSRNLVLSQVIDCPRRFPAAACYSCQYCCMEASGCCGECLTEKWYFWFGLATGVIFLIALYIAYWKYRKMRQVTEDRSYYSNSHRNVTDRSYELNVIVQPYRMEQRPPTLHHHQKHSRQRPVSQQALQRLSEIELQQEEYRLEHELNEVKRHLRSKEAQNSRNSAHDQSSEAPPLYSTLRFNDGTPK